MVILERDLLLDCELYDSREYSLLGWCLLAMTIS